MLSAEIVYIVLGDLAARGGLDIEELVDDPDIYEEIIDTLIDKVQNKLQHAVHQFLETE